MAESTLVRSWPPLFGERRALQCPPLERFDVAAGDGTLLHLHHTSGGTRGPVVITAGTAMTALSYCIDTAPVNLVEFLVARGFDVWLLDWRTSPTLAAHTRPYTLADVARFDWPAGIDAVLRRTGRSQVAVLAHCLSSTAFFLSLVRGHLPAPAVRSFVASQVALHLVFTRLGMLRLRLRLDWLLHARELAHQTPPARGVADRLVALIAPFLRADASCRNPACPRQRATFGELIHHQRVDPATHALMGDLVPECVGGFLKDVAIWGRHGTVLTDDDRDHLARLRLPIHFISGRENRMFVPESTARTFDLLVAANGSSGYRRTVYDGFGHLDCYFGRGAADEIWPDIAATLDS